MRTRLADGLRSLGGIDAEGELGLRNLGAVLPLPSTNWACLTRKRKLNLCVSVCIRGFSMHSQ